ncbi:MAG TPA: 2OG-Fe(II) oxygenase [Roseomonas sp.]|jgi:hypothetical protein
MSDTIRGLTRAIQARLLEERPRLQAAFGVPRAGHVRHFALDELLPREVIGAAVEAMPPLPSMLRLANTKERKFVCARLDSLNGPVRDIVTAINQPEVAAAIAGITGMATLETDPQLYNGGITYMLPGDYMCPHLDNSHDHARRRRREVVLLTYLSPYWREDYGGHLALWQDQRRGALEPVPYRSNRLVVMETTDASWHAVTPIAGPMPRINVTTYFYAPSAVQHPVRLTRFAAWPGHGVRHAVFTGEFALRSLANRMGARRLRPNRHINSTSGPSGP